MWPRGNTGCISIFEQVLTVNYFTTVTTFTANTTVNIDYIIVLIAITATTVSSVNVGY